MCLIEIMGEDSYYPTPFFEIRESFEKGVLFHYNKCCINGDNNNNNNNISSCYIEEYDCRSYNLFRDSCINKFNERYKIYLIIIIISICYEVIIFFVVCRLSHCEERKEFNRICCCKV